MEHNMPSHRQYEIVVQGYLEPRYEGWFEGMTLTTREDGTTSLRGVLADQAALYGLLSRIRDLGLVLWLVRRVEEGSELPQ